MRHVSLVAILSLYVFLVACSSDDKKADTAEGAYAIAQDYEKNDRYDEAIRRFQEVKNKFPYSKYATMAELAIGDTYYKQESYAEAQVAFQSFKDLHPKHPQIDYVTYMLGMSYFKQLPSTVDRDLSLASSAILFFEEVMQQYPNSKYNKESRENRDNTINMLAQKEDYIGDFYYKRGNFESALPRYENLAKKFKGNALEAKALARASIAASKIGEQEKANRYRADFKKSFPAANLEAEASKGLE